MLFTSGRLLLLILSSQPRFYPLITLFLFLLHLCTFIIDNCNYGSVFRKGIKIKIFYFLQKFIEKLKCMLLRQFCLGNNLPTHIRENRDLTRQKPRQLPRPEANFEDCIFSFFTISNCYCQCFVSKRKSG